MNARHNHPGDAHAKSIREVYRYCKAKGREERFKSAKAVAEHLIVKKKDALVKSPKCPNVENLVRAINREKSKSRPKEPQDIHFQPEESYGKGIYVLKYILIILATLSLQLRTKSIYYERQIGYMSMEPLKWLMNHLINYFLFTLLFATPVK